jgi:hypothetical protein
MIASMPADGKYSVHLMVVQSNVQFSDDVEEALTFQVSPSNNAAAEWSFRLSMAQGCALLDVLPLEVIPDGAVAEELNGSAVQV